MGFDTYVRNAGVACAVISGLHLVVIGLEWIYRQWCYPMNGWMDTLFTSVITRHSSICVTLKQTINTLDDVLRNYLIHALVCVTATVLGGVRISREK